MIELEPRFWSATKIEHNLYKIANILPLSQRVGDVDWENTDECFKVVDDLCVGICQF
jgi:hypothetical protein